MHGTGCDRLSMFDDAEEDVLLNRSSRSITHTRSIHCPSINATVVRLKARLEQWRTTRLRNPQGCWMGNDGVCNGRGQCVQGWCQCQATGAFGIDCAHGDRPRSSPPLVLALYVYELPPDLGFNQGRRLFPLYRAEDRFLAMLLRDWSIRTLDPERADLFVTPTFDVYGPASNIGCDRARLEIIVSYLRAHYVRPAGLSHHFFRHVDFVHAELMPHLPPVGPCALAAILGPPQRSRSRLLHDHRPWWLWLARDECQGDLLNTLWAAGLF